jgi:hypothetical protein
MEAGIADHVWSLEKIVVCCLDFGTSVAQLSTLGCVARYEHKDYQMSDCGDDSVAGSLVYDSAGWKPVGT